MSPLLRHTHIVLLQQAPEKEPTRLSVSYLHPPYQNYRPDYTSFILLVQSQTVLIALLRFLTGAFQFLRLSYRPHGEKGTIYVTERTSAHSLSRRKTVFMLLRHTARLHDLSHIILMSQQLYGYWFNNDHTLNPSILLFWRTMMSGDPASYILNHSDRLSLQTV